MFDYILGFVGTALFISFFDFVGDMIFSMIFFVLIAIVALLGGTGLGLYRLLKSLHSKFK